jgi:regulatory protein
MRRPQPASEPVAMDQHAQTLQRAKQQAYRLLTYRSRTASELRDRLQQRGYTTTIIAEVLSQLESSGYIDDRRVAIDWARYRLQTKPTGRRRMAWELKRRGVTLEVLEEVLHEVYGEFDETRLAERAVRKRLGLKELPASPRELQRLARYLIGLGFEADTVTAALGALGSIDQTGKIAPTNDTDRDGGEPALEPPTPPARSGRSAGSA